MDGRRDLEASEIVVAADAAARAPCPGSPLRRAARSRCTPQHTLISRNAGAMGKSHRSKKLKIHEEDFGASAKRRSAGAGAEALESAERKMEVERAKSATTKFSKAVKHGKKGELAACEAPCASF